MRATWTALSGVALAIVCQQATLPARAQGQPDDVLRVVFETQDANRNKRISPREAAIYRDLVFVSMDADESGGISPEEFQTWDPGYQALADRKGRGDAVKEVKRRVFAAWDRNRDGAVSEDEMSSGLFLDFAGADENRDGSLDIRELGSGPRLHAAMADALR